MDFCSLLRCKNKITYHINQIDECNHVIDGNYASNE